MCTDDELHQRTETPNGRRAQNMQARHGRFKPLAQTREPLKTAYRLRKLGREEVVLSYIHSISGSKEHMVDGSLRAVTELDPEPLAQRNSGDSGMAELHWHILESSHQPAGASRTDGSVPQPVLNG